MPRGGKREGAGRRPCEKSKKRKIIKGTSFNTKEWIKVSRAMKGLKFSCSMFLRRAALTYAKDQEALNLSPDDLRRIEDIMAVGGYKTKGEAVSASLVAKRRELMKETIVEKMEE